jgi:DNA-binding NarL/FixJ family response regulator
VGWSERARTFFAKRGFRGWAATERLERALLRAADQFHASLALGRTQLLVPGVRIELAGAPPARGETRRLLALILADDAMPAERTPAEDLLTPRLRTIARLAADGQSAPAIAAELRLSVSTVRGYLAEIYQLLGVTKRAQLAAILSARRS